MSTGKLFVKDSRTGQNYEIEIQNNAVNAAEFSQIKASAQGTKISDNVQGGLRIYDPSLEAIAVKKSNLTFLDAYNGRLFYRGREIDDLVDDYDFEDASYYMIFGSLPSSLEKAKFMASFAEAASSPAPEIRSAITSIPYVFSNISWGSVDM
jgi:citrate synthase